MKPIADMRKRIRTGSPFEKKNGLLNAFHKFGKSLGNHRYLVVHIPIIPDEFYPQPGKILLVPGEESNVLHKKGKRPEIPA